MNNPDQISERMSTIFWVKILKILRCGSGIRNKKIRIRDPGWKKIRIRDTESKVPESIEPKDGGMEWRDEEGEEDSSGSED
jgi:hypothetical protein